MSEYYVEKSLDIDAPVERVWDLLIDVDSWSEWKPFIKKAAVAGGYKYLSNGSKLKMSLIAAGQAPVPLRVTVSEFQKPNSLAWEGGVKGLVHAVHGFELKEVAGKTRITSRERFQGALVGFVLRIVTPEDMEAMHEKWVQAFKDKLEGKSEEPEEDAHGHSH